MTDSKIAVYSADGLSQKLDKLGLSKREAAQIKLLIKKLEKVPIHILMKNRKVHKIAGAKDLYVYKISQHTRLVLSPLTNIYEQGVIIYDILNIKNEISAMQKARTIKRQRKEI